jgi:hypothetical protein
MELPGPTCGLPFTIIAVELYYVDRAVTTYSKMLVAPSASVVRAPLADERSPGKVWGWPVVAAFYFKIDGSGCSSIPSLPGHNFRIKI